MSPKKINPQKASAIKELKEQIANSKSIAVVDYKGLKVSQATELRRSIKKAGGNVVVTKNTLFCIASGISDLKIDGPSAFVFSNIDEVAAIKAIADYAKKNNLPTFKLGMLDGKLLSKDQITSLAALPSKDVLVGKTVSSLKSPLFKLVYSLNWNISQLVRTLEAVRVKKS